MSRWWRLWIKHWLLGMHNDATRVLYAYSGIDPDHGPFRRDRVYCGLCDALLSECTTFAEEPWA